MEKNSEPEWEREVERKFSLPPRPPFILILIEIVVQVKRNDRRNRAACLARQRPRLVRHDGLSLRHALLGGSGSSSLLWRASSGGSGKPKACFTRLQRRHASPGG